MSANVCIPVYDASGDEWMLTATVHFGREAGRVNPAEPDDIEMLVVTRDGTEMSFDDWAEANGITQKRIDAICDQASEAAYEAKIDAIAARADYDYERAKDRAAGVG